MDRLKITPRERLQMVYDLAFFPPRLHEFWGEINSSESFDRMEIKQLLADALLLHLALPEKGFQSQRALKRVAGYQASAKAFGIETFIKNIAKRLGLDVTTTTNKIPAAMIRDIKLPEFSHSNKKRF